MYNDIVKDAIMLNYCAQKYALMTIYTNNNANALALTQGIEVLLWGIYCFIVISMF